MNKMGTLALKLAIKEISDIVNNRKEALKKKKISTTNHNTNPILDGKIEGLEEAIKIINELLSR